MNNEIVNEKELILLYGLRTARQKKRAKYKDFEKAIRRLYRQREELWEKRRNLSWIELTQPVMRGWKRYFVLRDDIAESIYATFFQGILDKINTTVFSNRKDFKTKKKRLRKWRYDVNKQQLLNLRGGELRKFFSEKEQSFFEERIIQDSRKIWVKVYVFKDPWRFVLKARPNMVTGTRIRSVEIEREFQQLESYITRKNLEPLFYRLRGDSASYWLREDFRKDEHPFRNMSLPQIMDSMKEVH